MSENFDQEANGTTLSSGCELYDASHAAFHKRLLNEMAEGKTIEGVQTRDRVKTLLSLISDFKGKTVLDVGTGVGLFASEITKMGGRVVGLDFSNAMLRTAQIVTKECNCPYLGLIQGCAPFIPIRDRSMDIVVLGDFVEHLEPEVLVKTIKESRRLLKPGGKLLIHSSPTKYYYLLTGSRTMFIMSTPILILPLPKIWAEALLDKLFQIRRFFRMMKGDKKPMAEPALDMHGHINCQTLRSLTQLLKASGFNVDVAFTKEIFIRNKKLFTSFPYLLVLPRNREYLTRSIFVAAQKPT